MARATITVSKKAAEDVLARLRPTTFLRDFIHGLTEQGEAVIARLFMIATSADVSPKDQLAAIKLIMEMSNGKDLLGVAMGLRNRRQGVNEEDVEDAKFQDEWANILDLEEQDDGTFSAPAKPAPPPRSTE